MAIIEVRDLVKRYGDFTAVKGISFDVGEGEIFGIVGPNGAGKTTTLEIIETLKDPTSGSVTIDGYDVVKSPWEVKRAHRRAVTGGRFLSRPEPARVAGAVRRPLRREG